ncbi:MAG: hypothetical protein WCR06_11500 [bacterium]
MNRVIYTFDSLGRQYQTCQDLNLNSQVDLSGPDRVSETSQYYEQTDGDWWQVSEQKEYRDDGQAHVVAASRTRLTGLSLARVSDSLSVNARGNVTESITALDATDARIRTTTTAYPDSTNAAVTLTINGLPVRNTGKDSLIYRQGYDALGRQVASQAPDGGIASHASHRVRP